MAGQIKVDFFLLFVGVILIALCVHTDQTEILNCGKKDNGARAGTFDCLAVPKNINHIEYLEGINTCSNAINSYSYHHGKHINDIIYIMI